MLDLKQSKVKRSFVMEKIYLTVKYKTRLQELMAREGFRNMQALADETGISRNMLYMFERGESHLTIPNLIKLLWAFDCRFEDLIQYEVESNEPNHWEDLSDKTQKAILDGRAEYRSKTIGKSA
jgi:DNA-binding Xre family transcriptional regulator